MDPVELQMEVGRIDTPIDMGLEEEEEEEEEVLIMRQRETLSSHY
jgi:hypothetical protein